MKGWSLFFDLHGVLIDIADLNFYYTSYLQKILKKAGLSSEKVKDLHDFAFKNWVREFRRINSADSQVHDSDQFMAEMAKIDKDWSAVFLKQVPHSMQRSIAKELAAPVAEYRAMAEGNRKGIFPDVMEALNCLKKDGFSMFIASSASESHIRGTLELNEIGHFFNRVFGYDVVRAPKKANHGFFFKEMLRITRSQGGHSIFIGDSIKEASLSMEHDMHYVMVDRKGKHNNIICNYEIIPSLKELPIIIAQITSE